MTPSRRALAFVGVGALGTAVQLGTFWVSLRWGHLHAAAATAIGVAAAVAHNFLWHRYWTWSDRRDSGASVVVTFARFALATGGVSLIGNVAIVWALVRALPVDGVAANLVAIALCALANYHASDRLVFVPSTFAPPRTSARPRENLGTSLPT